MEKNGVGGRCGEEEEEKEKRMGEEKVKQAEE